MKNCIILIVLLPFFGNWAHAQERPKKASFDYELIRKDAEQRANQALTQLVASTACGVELPDLEGTLNYFSPNAFIEVSAIPAKRIIRLNVAAYAAALHALRCSDTATYRSISFNFEPVKQIQELIIQNNDTCWVTVPIRQYFIGRGGGQKMDYADITIKNIVFRYYMKDGIVHGEIDRVLAGRTTNYHQR